MLSDVTDLFTFYTLPSCIHSTVYSTNLIEGLNKHFKRAIGHKEQFPNEDSLERFACAYFSELNAKFSERLHKGFAVDPAALGALFVQLNSKDILDIYACLHKIIDTTI